MAKTVRKTTQWQIKALTVKLTIARVQNMSFAKYTKCFIILESGRVPFVLYLPFSEYSTDSIILNMIFYVKLIKKYVVLHGLKLWKFISFLEAFCRRTIEFIREFVWVRLKILHIYASQTMCLFWAQCIVWSKGTLFVRFDNFSK